MCHDEGVGMVYGHVTAWISGQISLTPPPKVICINPVYI